MTRKKAFEVDPVHAMISNQVKMWKVIRELEKRIIKLEKQKG